MLSGVWLFCDLLDCIPLGSSIHGTFQARILEWVAISFSRGYSWPSDQIHVFCLAGKLFYHCATWGFLLNNVKILVQKKKKRYWSKKSIKEIKEYLNNCCSLTFYEYFFSNWLKQILLSYVTSPLWPSSSYCLIKICFSWIFKLPEK